MKSIKLLFLFFTLGAFTLNAQLQTFPESGELDSLGKNLMKPLNDNFNLHQSAINSNTLSISELETMVDDSFAYYRIVTKSNKDSILLLRVDMSAIEDSLQALRALVNAIDTSGSGGGEPPVINYPVTDFTITPATLSVNEGNGTPYFLGKFSATDPEDSLVTYAKRSGTGDTNNILFSINNDSLFLTTTVNYDLGATRSLRAGASDGNSWVEKVFTLNVIDTVFTPPPVIEDTLFVHVNVCRYNETYDNDAWNNTDSEFFLSDLKDEEGGNTGISLTLENWLVTSSTYAENNAELPGEVEGSYYRTAGANDTAAIEFSGLEANSPYIFRAYLSNESGDRTADLTFNDGTEYQDYAQGNNNQLLIDTITASSEGKIKLVWSDVQDYAYINYLALKITDKDKEPTLAPPGNLSGAVVSTDVVLTWTDNNSIENGYEIYFKDDNDEAYTLLHTTNADVETYTHTSVSADIKLYYYLVAFNDSLTSSATDPVIVVRSTTPPSDPVIGTATASYSSVTITWEPFSNANTVYLQESSDNTTFTTALTLSGTATSGTVTGLSSESIYYFRIYAENNNGTTGYSDTLQATTSTPAARYVPSIKGPNDFANVVYIDLNAGTDGDGSKASPRNQFIEYANQSENTAYLLKAGSSYYLNGSIEMKNNTLLGAYGTGNHTNMPTIEAGVNFPQSANNITIRDINFKFTRGASKSLSQSDGYTSNCTFAFCKFIGYDNGNGYPYRIAELKGTNWLTYRCEFANSKDDLWYANSAPGFTFISNYMRNANLNGATDPMGGSGDCLQLESGYFINVRIEDNFLDRSKSFKKFCLLIGDKYQNDENIIVRYNTFYSPKPGPGAGAGIYVKWMLDVALIEKNLFVGIDNTGNIPQQSNPNTTMTIFSFDDMANLDYPNGVHKNLVVHNASTYILGYGANMRLKEYFGYTSSELGNPTTGYETGNVLFKFYDQYLSSNYFSQDYGSSIKDTSPYDREAGINFWGNYSIPNF